MSKGVRALHDGLVKTGKLKDAKVIDEFNPNHISFNSFCAIFDRRLAVSHATLCVELRLEGLTKRQFLEYLIFCLLNSHLVCCSVFSADPQGFPSAAVTCHHRRHPDTSTRTRKRMSNGILAFELVALEVIGHWSTVNEPQCTHMVTSEALRGETHEEAVHCGRDGKNIPVQIHDNAPGDKHRPITRFGSTPVTSRMLKATLSLRVVLPIIGVTHCAGHMST